MRSTQIIICFTRTIRNLSKMEPISNSGTSGHTQKYDPGRQRKDACVELAATTRLKALRQSNTLVWRIALGSVGNLGRKAGNVREGERGWELRRRSSLWCDASPATQMQAALHRAPPRSTKSNERIRDRHLIRGQGQTARKRRAHCVCVCGASPVWCSASASSGLPSEASCHAGDVTG